MDFRWCREKVFFALDCNDWETAKRWISFFSPRVRAVKVGLEAWFSFGIKAVEEIVKNGGKVFLDLKLHDIPRTVERTVSALSRNNVEFLTVHLSGGRRVLRAAVEGSKSRIKILGVTLLTHLSEEEIDSIYGHKYKVLERMKTVAIEEGAYGVITSPHELHIFRCSRLVKVTPGIRIRNVSLDDQRRVASPLEALEKGADFIVVGRALSLDEESSLTTDMEVLKSNLAVLENNISRSRK